MIPTFRQTILAVDDLNKSKIQNEDNLLYQLQCIFAFLNQSEQQYYNPQGFTNAFKDWDGNPTNVLIQMDVDEFFNMFMDKLETAIKGSDQEKMIQEHFGGTYANELICKGCPHYSSRSEPYLAVNLQVKNKKSIKESLEALIEGEMLDGDNSYYCEKWDKKVPTLKRTCISRLPKHLILVLKRFEFDYDTMQKVKVNAYWEFPEILNMEPYTQTGLKRREKNKQTDNDAEENYEAEEQPKYPLELYDYKLSGVLVHSGYAEGGHYYSFIKDREDETGADAWYEFNDENVKDFDKADLESEWFGGEEKWSDMMGHSIYLKNSEKHRNAYLLFYERISNEDIPYSDDEDLAHTTSKDNKESHKETSDIPMASENEIVSATSDLKLISTETTIIPAEIRSLLQEENRKYWQYRFMFSKDYSEFILELWSLWNTNNVVPLNYDTRNRDYHILGIDENEYKEELKRASSGYPEGHYLNKNIRFYPEKHLHPSESCDIYQKYGGELVDAYEFEIFKLAATFYLTVTQRAALKEMVTEFLDLIKAHLNKNINAWRWLITQFSNTEVLFESTLHCPVQDMRRLTIGLIYWAMIRLYEEEKELLDQYWQDRKVSEDAINKSLLGNFINIVLWNFEEARKLTEYNPQYFSILSRFASLGKEARLYLLKAKTVGRLLYYVKETHRSSEPGTAITQILTFYEPSPEIGLPYKLENAKLSLWEELFMRKRDAQIADANQDFTYIFETLSWCIRSWVLTSEEWLTYVDDLRYTDLERKELHLLGFDEKDLFSLISSSTSKVAAKHLGSILIHLWAGNLGFDTMLRQVLLAGINDKQLDEIKPYFPIFKRYLFIQDENSEARVAEGIREYFNVLKNNIKYASFMAKFTTFLVKLWNIHRGVAEFLYSCSDEWDWVIELIRKLPVPSKGNQQLKSQTREIATAQYKIKRLEDVQSGNIITYEDEYDSDDDMSNCKFFKDQKIDLKHAGQTWLPAEVVVSLDEMISVQYFVYNQQKSDWLKIDCDDIAPYMSMIARHDTKAIEQNRAELEAQYKKNMQQYEESIGHHSMSENERYQYNKDDNENESVSD